MGKKNKGKKKKKKKAIEIDVWEKLENVKESDNWIEIKTRGGTKLRFSKSLFGPAVPIGLPPRRKEGFGDCESFECPPEDAPKRKVVVDGSETTYSSAPQFSHGVTETRMERPGQPTVVGVPAPAPGGTIRAAYWDAGQQKLFNTGFWPPSPQ